MSAKLFGNGTISIIMVINLQRFIQSNPTVWEEFNNLRGSSAYAAFLKQLRPHKWFVVDDQEEENTTQGHALGVFRRYLINNSFFSSYRLTDNDIIFPKLDRSAASKRLCFLCDGKYIVRLTRNGMVVVKMEYSLQKTAFIDMSQLILEVAENHEEADIQSQLPTQWLLAMNIVARFVEACGHQFVIRHPYARKPVVIPLSSQFSMQPIPRHDRHIIYALTDIQAEQMTISVQELRERYAHAVACLIGNTVLIEKDGSVHYPEYKDKYIHDLHATDCAHRKDEMCLLTPEVTFMYTPTIGLNNVYINSAPQIDPNMQYQAYWRGIARGIEHIITLKHELQLLERKTTNLLEKVPDLTRKVTDGNLSRADKREITDLSRGLATLFQSLPQQRDMLVASSVFRDGNAVYIFQFFIDVLGITYIEKHTQSHVEELNTFLSHYNNMQIQQDTQRTNLTFSLLMIAVSILVIPSFLADATQIGWLQQEQVMPIGIYILTFLQEPTFFFNIPVGWTLCILLGSCFALLLGKQYFQR